MKFDNFSQTSLIGGAALALILAMGSAQAGKPGANPNDPDEGPNNKGGASIGASSTCELASDPDTSRPVLRVATTIINKSSGDATPDFTENGSALRAKEKANKSDKYKQVGATTVFTASLGTTVRDVQLCVGDDLNGYSYPVEDTVNLNASVSINVDNDNKGEYSHRCSDDPATEGVDEGKIAVSAADLNLLCSQ
jgi:hypothetical protein